MPSDKHGEEYLVNIDYLIFGIYNSDEGNLLLYKLTQSALYVDRSSSWVEKRHSKEGYIFTGEKMPSEKFHVVKSLREVCPINLLDNSLKGFYTTGNKNEDKLILQISGRNFFKSITIDAYDKEIKQLPKALTKFRLLIENCLKKIRN